MTTTTLTVRPEVPAAALTDSVGVCTHLTAKPSPYYDNFDRVLPFIQDLGIKHVRDDAIYFDTTTRDAYLYQRLRTFAAGGIKLSLVCHDPLNGYVYTPPSKVGNIFDWCDGAMSLFEGANEPDLLKNTNINPLIQRDHQTALFNSVLSNSHTRSIPVASPSFIQDNIAKISGNYSSIVHWMNIHPYPGMEHPETATATGSLQRFIAAVKPIYSPYENKPVVASETGYHTALQTTSTFFPVSEAIKTRYLPRLLLWYFISAVKRAYLYQLIDHIAPSVTDKEANFGLVDFNLNPKPSYAAVKRVMGLMRSPAGTATPSPTLTITGDNSNVQQALFQRADGSHVLFAWLGVAGWNAGTRTALAPITRRSVLASSMTFSSIKATLFRDDGTASVAPLAHVVGGYDLPVSDQLIAVELR
jgi:hypothetical protein